MIRATTKKEQDLVEKERKIDIEYSKNLRQPVPGWLIGVVSFTFAWVFVGISIILGIRFFWNSPIHPSFALFGATVFSSIIAFAIVITLEIVTGKDVSFKFAGLEFTGTSGPVTLWILTFIAIMSTFIAGGITDLSESKEIPNPPLHKLWESEQATQSPPQELR